MRYKITAILAAALILLGTAVSAIPAYGADKSVLQTVVSRTMQMDISGYTEESAAFLQSALNSSAQVIGDENAGSLRISNHVTLLNAVSNAMVIKADASVLSSGDYTIQGILRQAFSDNASMGNEAIIKPMELIAEDGEITLRLHFSFLTVPGLGQGYLSELSYLPDWDGLFSDMTDAQFLAFTDGNVEEYYEDVYDRFNDPDTDTDAAIKGKLYPKSITMPVAYQDAEVWMKVYVPIMESISAGGGEQYARLQLDWSTLTWTAPEKSALDTAVKQLAWLKQAVAAADYTQEMVDLLEQAVTTGTDALNRTDIGQSGVDAMTQALNAVANLFADADKQYLNDMIQLAGKYTTSDYADDYVADMKKRIQAAQEVYNNAFATQTQVNEQYALLLQAISNAKLKEKEAAPAPVQTPVSAETSTETKTPEETKTSADNEERNLDKDNLEDGVYAITGEMYKIDKRTASMANDAVNHTIKLTVTKGNYKITLDFMGLSINGSYGYLSKMKYYKTGYTIDSYGSPQGTLKAVTVDSWQQDSSGVRISDTYGTDYPNQVTFPLISEAIKDGYVPLQVYVPIMEAISAGTGTQSVFLFLDWNTLKSTTNKNDDFADNQNTNPSNTSVPQSSLTLNTPLSSGSVSLAGGSTSIKSAEISKPKDTDTGLSEFAGLSTETIPTVEASAQTADTETQTQTADTGTISSGGAAEEPSPATIPTVMSVLMTGAGILFKVKSRGGL